MLKADQFTGKPVTLWNIAYELDCLKMDIEAVRHIVNEVCERFPPTIQGGATETDRDLHGGLERTLWRILDSITEDLTILSEASEAAASA